MEVPVWRPLAWATDQQAAYQGEPSGTETLSRSSLKNALVTMVKNWARVRVPAGAYLPLPMPWTQSSS